MELAFTPEQQELVRTVRAFTKKELAPHTAPSRIRHVRARRTVTSLAARALGPGLATALRRLAANHGRPPCPRGPSTPW